MDLLALIILVTTNTRVQGMTASHQDEDTNRFLSAYKRRDDLQEVIQHHS